MCTVRILVVAPAAVHGMALYAMVACVVVRAQTAWQGCELGWGG